MSKLDFTKEKRDLFLLTELLICKSSKNITEPKETAEDMANNFCQFYKFDTKSKEYKVMYNFAKESTEYMNKLSAIMCMYSTFEQYLKVSLNPNNNEKLLEEKIEKVCEKYEYNMKENTYYDIYNKYRMINNSIKHGNPKRQLFQEYPELENKECDINKYGTILDSSLNITDEDVEECCFGLCKFVLEMYNYFEDFGYIN